jgi:hypothetical protein
MTRSFVPRATNFLYAFWGAKEVRMAHKKGEGAGDGGGGGTGG